MPKISKKVTILLLNLIIRTRWTSKITSFDFLPAVGQSFTHTGYTVVHVLLSVGFHIAFLLEVFFSNFF